MTLASPIDLAVWTCPVMNLDSLWFLVEFRACLALVGERTSRSRNRGAQAYVGKCYQGDPPEFLSGLDCPVDVNGVSCESGAAILGHGSRAGSARAGGCWRCGAGTDPPPRCLRQLCSAADLVLKSEAAPSQTDWPPAPPRWSPSQTRSPKLARTRPAVRRSHAVESTLPALHWPLAIAPDQPSSDSCSARRQAHRQFSTFALGCQFGLVFQAFHQFLAHLEVDERPAAPRRACAAPSSESPAARSSLPSQMRGTRLAPTVAGLTADCRTSAPGAGARRPVGRNRKRSRPSAVRPRPPPHDDRSLCAMRRHSCRSACAGRVTEIDRDLAQMEQADRLALGFA